MISDLPITKDTVIQFIKFGIVGITNTVINYTIYVILVYFDMSYIFASICAFIISVINAFIWNNVFVFKKQEGEKRNLWKALVKTFLSYAGTSLVLHNILLAFFVEILRISKYIAPLISLVITIPLNFLLNKFWSFKGEKAE